jgi:hypothetical protein
MPIAAARQSSKKICRRVLAMLQNYHDVFSEKDSYIRSLVSLGL